MKQSNKILIIICFLSLSVNVLFLLFSFLRSEHFRSLIAVQEEIYRIAAPDSIVDAVLIRYNGGGATCGFSYQVYIVPHNQKELNTKYVYSANKIDGLSIAWMKSKCLEINYKKGRIFYFSNFWFSKKVDNFGYIVEVKLKAI